ncbi:MAG: thioesterase domain-containing protein [Candidatus Azotimanducaceae bacterium]|jgi:thioesterase domain-containing protein
MNNKSQSLEQFIHESIPLSRALGYHIQELTSNRIEVTAPLEPNINHHNAAFAGSIYSVAALTAWSLVTHLVNEAQLSAAVVMGKAEIMYKRPILEEIYCSGNVTASTASEFVLALQGKGRAKIELSIAIGNQSEAVLNAVVFATNIEQADKITSSS